MKKVVLFFFAIALLFASGCQGIQVVDNTYDSIGGKKFHVADDLEYKGVADVYSRSRDVNGSVIHSQNIKVRSDIFVKADADNSIEKFAFIEYRRIGGRYYWVPVKGPRFEFGGYPYVKYITFSDGTDKHSQYYVSHLKEQGYDLSMKEGVVCFLLERNFSKNKKGILGECINTEYLPKEDMTREEIEAFLGKDFKRVFSPVE